MSQRSTLYRLSRYLAEVNETTSPVWRTSTITFLRQFNATQNEINQTRMNVEHTRIQQQSRPLPFIQQIRSFQWNQALRFIPDEVRHRPGQVPLNIQRTHRNNNRNLFTYRYDGDITAETLKVQLQQRMGGDDYFVSFLDMYDIPIFHQKSNLS